VSLPPFLAGAAVLFWGWHSGNVVVAVPVAVLLETPRFVRLRFALDATDYARIADLCTVFFVGLAVVIAANRGVAHGVIGAFQWVPAVLSPILLAQRLGEADRVPLTALFRYLRKLKERQPELKVPMVDTSGVFVALCVISAGVGNPGPASYYAGAVLLAGWALYASRPRHARVLTWVLMLALGAALGYAGGAGLAQAQHWIGGALADWHLRRGESDPSRGMTDIGTLGRLKERDTIVARVYGAPEIVSRAGLLHRASYNAYVGTTWLGRRAQRNDLQPGEGGATWTLAPGAGHARLDIAQRVERRSTVLALPPGVTRLTGLAANSVNHTGLGLVQAAVEGDWIQYGAQFGGEIAHYDPPGVEDWTLPPAERAVFHRIAQELGLAQMTAAQAVRRVMLHFAAGFSYSLWRDTPPPAGMTPLADFMTHTKSGHCEYFAAAATILLRAAGVPARYATGYAVMEYSTLEQAYVVRARHAHAWTRAHVDGRWIDLDPTPPDWFVREKNLLAPLWEKALDLLRWAAYRWSQRAELEAGDAWWGVLALLAAILAWRLLRGKRVVRQAGAAAPARRYPGMDSEFYALAKALPARAQGETLACWLERVAPGKYDEALRLHQRYRFDPLGLAQAERARLRELCRAPVAQSR
jgi:transglutaminase-like putative cysteine protease